MSYILGINNKTSPQYQCSNYQARSDQMSIFKKNQPTFLLALASLLYTRLIIAADVIISIVPIPFEETYFDIKISDPCPHIEKMDDPKVDQWMCSQAKHTRVVLNNISGPEKLLQEMRAMDERKAEMISSLIITKWRF